MLLSKNLKSTFIKSILLFSCLNTSIAMDTLNSINENKNQCNAPKICTIDGRDIQKARPEHSFYDLDEEKSYTGTFVNLVNICLRQLQLDRNIVEGVIHFVNFDFLLNNPKGVLYNNSEYQRSTFFSILKALNTKSVKNFSGLKVPVNGKFVDADISKVQIHYSAKTLPRELSKIFQ